jgi:acetyl esterase/lipase
LHGALRCGVSGSLSGIRLFLLVLLWGSASACAARLPPATANRLLNQLFAPPIAQEIAAVEAEWARRDTGAYGTRVEWEHRERDGTRTLVLSHTVGGFRHYGAVRIPGGHPRRKLPVLVVAHGGQRGTTALQFFRSGALATGWVQVLPSYRSERLFVTPLRWYRSEAPPSPWDRDVDDALALLNAVLQSVPEADSTRVASLGHSRGAGVALLMAVRDPRIRGVVDYSGPTDFLLPEVRRLANRALHSRIPRLPGAGYLADSVLFALRDQRIPVERARMELLRRSPAYFASRLPPTQIHHGTGDSEVAVAHGRRLSAALRRIGRAPPRWTYYEYPGGGHRPRSLRGSHSRAEQFLEFVVSAQQRGAGQQRPEPRSARWDQVPISTTPQAIRSPASPEGWVR